MHIPSMGWEIPSAGEVGLRAVVSSVVVLDKFCSFILSARFGTADAWLDVIGRISQDAFVNDQYVHRCRNPSNQADSAICYAHAAAGVIHMTLLRIVSREGGYPSIQEIREKVLAEFPPEQGVRNMAEVLEAARRWYRPLRFRKVDEDGARQAVLRRRPVLAGFYLCDLGWDMFEMHFTCNSSNHTNDPIPVLTRAQMAPQWALVPDNNGGGHAVVMTGCAPHSLTFINSWGSNWGNIGSFSIEGPAALELEGPWGRYPMSFYDVFWLENELTPAERQAYTLSVDERLRVHSAQYTSILELELCCPDCRANAPLIRYTGNTQQVRCPRCQQSFAPEPGYIVEALCTQRGNN